MDTILILDFGGQYSHLISRRIRDLGVFSEVKSPGISVKELKEYQGLKGIILSGGAASIYADGSPICDKAILELSIPVLGICYGHQVIAHLLDGQVSSGESGEYGITEMEINADSLLFNSLEKRQEVWMNHKDVVTEAPSNFKVIASTQNSPIAAYADEKRKIYGVQFHPEVVHTINGNRILENFAFKICKAEKSWSTADIVNRIYDDIRKALGAKRCIIGLSGGVDSSTAALLVSNVIGKDLVAVYVDTGLMRQDETKFIENVFLDSGLDLRIVNARERFFKELEGIIEPERKRKIIGRLFIDIFDEIAEKENAEVIIQGTIYSDRIESGITQHSDTIKSHHNVGGLPQDVRLEVYEPLRDIYKDEVRKVAKEIGLPEALIKRQVFPGPGLAIRIVGEITPERVEIVRKASFIVEEEVKRAGFYDDVWMAFAVLLPIKSVGIQGDSRSYKYPVVVRIIESTDAMTANFAKVPYQVLENISTRITNEIMEVNRVVYDISNKPPATMEWE